MPAFDSIFGQSGAIEGLRGAFLAGRLPHGMIFAGPRGVGKETTAKALGTLFLCRRVDGDAPCDVCESCRLMKAGNHPDYHVVYRQLIRLEKTAAKARDLTVDVVRDYIVAPANRTANLGWGKVFVIEEAELMNNTAQNSLLKTLEEPLGRTLIVLLTERPAAMLPTIRSRCRLVQFAALDASHVAQALHQRGIDPALARKAAELAGGSLGLAIEWIEDGVIDAADQLLPQLDALFNATPPDDLPAWFKASADAYALKQLERDELASKDQANREGLGLYLQLAAEHVRRKLTAFSQSRDADHMERACAIIDALCRAEAYLDANVNIPLLFQQLASALERQAAR